MVRILFLILIAGCAPTQLPPAPKLCKYLCFKPPQALYREKDQDVYSEPCGSDGATCYGWGYEGCHYKWMDGTLLKYMGVTR